MKDDKRAAGTLGTLFQLCPLYDLDLQLLIGAEHTEGSSTLKTY